MIIGQLPTQAWQTYLNYQTLADVILDRVVHSSDTIKPTGTSSMREQAGTVDSKTDA